MVNLKCDETCKGGDNCTNSRIYIGLPSYRLTILRTVEAAWARSPRRPQGRGVFPDMMPYRVKFYGNDDCLLHYEDHTRPSRRWAKTEGSSSTSRWPRRAEPGLPAGYYMPSEAKGQSAALAVRGRGGPPRGNYGRRGQPRWRRRLWWSARGGRRGGATTAAAAAAAADRRDRRDDCGRDR